MSDSQLPTPNKPLTTTPTSVAPTPPVVSAPPTATPGLPTPPMVPAAAVSPLPTPGGTVGVKPPMPASAGQPPLPPQPAQPSPVATSGGPTPPPQVAKVKRSPFRWLPFIVGGVVLILVVLFAISRLMGGSSTKSVTKDSSTGKTAPAAVAPTKQTTLTYWGLWEPESVMQPILKDFETQHPGTIVQYVKQNPTEYRQRLQTAIASGTGPDLFRFHASWVPMLKNELSPAPSSVLSASEFQSTFYPIAAQQLVVGGQVVGVPLMYDGLALYYNKSILETAQAQPPQTWAELRELAVALTIADRTGEIERAGLAIGTTNNVDHFSDILGLLMIQNGADPAKPTSQAAIDALTFYTNFVKTNPVWSASLPNSTVAFARGEVAMILAPSWRALDIRQLNPQLDFGVAGVPALAGQEIGWATYWAEGVSAQSKQKDLAWQLLDYLSSKEVQQKLYSQQSQVRSFGEPYSRTDLATMVGGDPVVGPILAQADQAKAWYLNSDTHDGGLNDQIIKYYEDAINAVVAGKTVAESMQTVAQGVSTVLRQYGLATQSPTAASSR